MHLVNVIRRTRDQVDDSVRDEQRRAGLEDVGAPAVHDADEALRLEPVDGLPNARAAHSELLGEYRLGGKLVAWPPAAGGDLLDETVRYLAGEARSARRL